MSRGTRAISLASGALLASVELACVVCAACAPIDTPGPERLDAEDVDDQMAPALPDAGVDASVDAGVDAGAGASCAPDAACRALPDASF